MMGLLYLSFPDRHVCEPVQLTVVLLEVGLCEIASLQLHEQIPQVHFKPGCLLWLIAQPRSSSRAVRAVSGEAIHILPPPNPFWFMRPPPFQPLPAAAGPHLKKPPNSTHINVTVCLDMAE